MTENSSDPAWPVFAAMYTSETWSEYRAALERSLKPRNKQLALYARTRAVVVHDRVLNALQVNEGV